MCKGVKSAILERTVNLLLEGIKSGGEIAKLLEESANVIAYDPKAMDNARKIFEDKIKYADSMDDALTNSDIALIVTDWKEFESIDFNGMRNRIVVDSRRIIRKDLLPEDVDYEGICW